MFQIIITLLIVSEVIVYSNAFLLRNLPLHSFQNIKTIVNSPKCSIQKIPNNYHKILSLNVMNKPQEIAKSVSQAIEPGSSDNIYPNPLRIPYLATWMIFFIYAFSLSPPDSVEQTEYTTKVVQGIIEHPYDGTINPVFVAIFNFLGVLPAIYSSLLLSAGKKQSIWSTIFLYGSFIAGFFATGPYLALRNINTSGEEQYFDFGTRLFESKLNAILLLGFSSYLMYYAVTNLNFHDSAITDFIELFKTNKLVHVSTIDFTILSLTMWDPIQEDIKRRKGIQNHVWFASVPVFGPILYLLLRPKLNRD